VIASATSYPQLEAPRCARYAPGEVIGDSAECFYSGRFESHVQMAILPQATGTCNITSLSGKEHELVEEAKRYSLDVVGISSTKRRDSNTVDVDNGWKLFYSGVDPAKFAQAGGDTFKPPAGKLC